MTFRRTAQLSLVAAALTVGATAIPLGAQAAPAPRSSVALMSVLPAPASARGDDPLVPVAATAIQSWTRYRSTGNQAALRQFRALRDAVAVEAGKRAGIDPARMRAAFAAANTPHQLALMTAFTQLGTPYHGYQRNPGKGFDCSGFTGWVWQQSGIQMPRTSRDQIRNVPNVDRSKAQAGDIVYYPGHVSIYLGVDNAIIHAPYTGRSVEVGHLGKSHTRSARFGDPIGDVPTFAWSWPSAVNWPVAIA
jgi:cell wall-associated NlpC family hydrolase